jgi:tetratricopeptide (TPR) repeat protein
LVGSVAVGASVLPPEAHAADFSRAKQTYVPPSKIPRRFDFESLRDTENYSSGYDSTSSYSYSAAQASTAAPKGGKYGLIPPPPPLTPSILPPSLMQDTLPTPPPMQGLSAGPAIRGNWKTQVSNGFKRVGEVSANSDTTSRAIARAQELVTEGKVEDAQALLKTYMKTSPKSAQLKSELTRVTLLHSRQFLKANDLENAARQAREAMTLDPLSVPAKNLLGEIITKSGFNPESAADRVKLGNQLLAQNKLSEASFEFRQGQKIKPTAEGYVGLGDLALKENKREQAKLEFQRALELEPNSSLALRQMGVLRYAQNDVIGANADLSRALILNPRDKLASNQLIDLWQKQVARNPQGANGHLGLARAHQLAGDLKSAQSEYKQVVTLDPENPNLPAARQSFKLALARQDAQKMVESAHALEAGGMTREAHQKVVDALGLMPNDVPTRIYEAQLSEKLGLFHQAKDAYMAVLKEDPKNAQAAQGLKALPAVSFDPSLAPAKQSFSGVPGSPQESPPGPAPPSIAGVTQPSHINNLSNFLVSLRNFSLTQKNEMSKVESTAQDAMRSSLGLGEGASAAAAAGAGALPAGLNATVSQLASAPAPTVDTASIANTLAQASAALSQAGVTPSAGAAPAPVAVTTTPQVAPTVVQPAAAPPTAPAISGFGSSLVDMAMQALPALKGFAPAAATTAAPATAATTTAAAATAAAAPVVAAATAPAAAAPGSLSSLVQSIPALQNVKSLDLANLYKKYKAPLEQKLGMKLPANLAAPPAAPAAAAKPAATAAAPAAAAQAAAPAAASVAAGALDPSFMQADADLKPMIGNAAPPLPPSLEDQNRLLQAQLQEAQQTINSLRQQNPSAASTLASSSVPSNSVSIIPSAMLLPELKTPGGSSVKLELEGVSPTASDIKLKVILKNDQNVPFDVPNGTKAIVRMNGKPQRNAKVSFASKQVPAGGEVHGTIKVPGHDLTPAADVFIPDFLPGAAADRDVHLTVPISSL